MEVSRLDILKWEREVASYMLGMMLEKNNQKQDTNVRDPELEKIVRYMTSKALINEEQITNELLELQEDQISYFVELDKRFKNSERIKEKIRQKMQVDSLSLVDASSTICDVLRYTIIVSDDVYIEKVDEYLKKIEGLGYQVIKFKNAWKDEYYKGINVSFINSEGVKFELQFHTPNGYAIKEGKVRDVYNIIRDPNSPKDLIEKANAIRKYYQAQVRVPKGAIDYNYSSMVRKRG